MAERGGIEPHPRKWTSRLAGGTNHRHSSLSVFARHSELESETLVLETKMITISPMAYFIYLHYNH
jgi:hypothetical protein